MTIDDKNKENDCGACKGTGKQTFHGAFDSFRATCNFCGGHGTREEEIKWYDKAFKERGLGCGKELGGTQ